MKRSRSEYDANLALEIKPLHPSRRRVFATRRASPIVRPGYLLALAYSVFLFLMDRSL